MGITLIALYTILSLGVFVYSYTQIDLNLTLSSNATYQSIQHQLIQIGYFNRPLSTWIYIGLILGLFILYLTTILLSYRGRLRMKDLVILIGVVTVVCCLSYPAFSYDIFNYMFDARILTFHHANPYVHKALDFPDDLWVRFMHWTHRTYPYGPFWLLSTLPFSVVGVGKFVPTLLSFKILFLSCFFGSAYLIWLIAKKILPTYAQPILVAYALNPLILIETIVSPHNEALLTVFFLLALYLLYVKKQFWWALGALIYSIGVKYVTLIATPVFVFPLLKKKPIPFNLAIWGMTVAFTLPFIAEVMNREAYPWYLIPLITTSVFLVSHREVIPSIIGVSLGALLRYAPVLYDGSYPIWVLHLEDQLFYISTSLGVFLSVVLFLKKKYVN